MHCEYNIFIPYVLHVILTVCIFAAVVVLLGCVCVYFVAAAVLLECVCVHFVAQQCYCSVNVCIL